MDRLTGTGALLRSVLRRDRVRFGAWLGAVLLLVVVTVPATTSLYSTQALLDEAARVSLDNPAALAFNGPPYALDTLGGQVAFQLGAFALVVVGLLNVLLVGRLTRGEEERGLLELVRSLGVGRHAPLAAALVAVLGVDLLVGAGTAAVLAANGLGTTGSLALGLSYVACGAVFAGVTAVTAQVTDNPRVASGSAGAVLGVAFVVRALGDIGSGSLSWLSPLGWAQQVRPFAGERWWALVPSVVAAVALVALAVQLAARRDLGAGMVAPLRGPAAAGPSLRSALGLAVRLQRAAIGWWAVATLLLGAAYGSLGDSIEDFIGDNQALADAIARAGVSSITDAYLATCLLLQALVAGGCAVQSALRARSEESYLRAEVLLATPLPRARWLGGHLAVSVVGTSAVVLAGGLGMGVGFAAVTGEGGAVGRLVLASAAYLPAVWVLTGLAAALVGLAPSAAAGAWAAFGLCLAVGMFGQLVDVPRLVLDLVPFEHVPAVPGAPARALPLVLTSLVAAAGIATGLAGFRRRDLVT